MLFNIMAHEKSCMHKTLLLWMLGNWGGVSRTMVQGIGNGGMVPLGIGTMRLFLWVEGTRRWRITEFFRAMGRAIRRDA